MRIAIRVMLSVLLGIFALIFLNLCFSYTAANFPIEYYIDKPEILKYSIILGIDIITIAVIFLPVALLLKKYSRDDFKYLEVTIVQTVVFISVVYNVSPGLFGELTFYNSYSILNHVILMFGLLMTFYVFTKKTKLK